LGAGAPGDVVFGWFAAGSFYSAHADYCEICWFYDRDAVFARRTDPGEPVRSPPAG
jgi:hypothetical protein